MLFDLRVVLAACLATFLFAAIGLSLLATSRSPFKTSAGYAANEGRGGLASPGLPKSRPLPLPETAEPETTGAIAEAPEATAAPEPAKPEKAAKAAPAGKKQSIKALIEEDKAEQEKAKAAKPAKKKAHARHRTKKPPPQKSPFSIFTNNNTAPTAVR